ncbi:YdcH family protein [Rhodovulum sp. DZ06]|uniref:YdcH family protein n=1 Tax=Rhodovulum sp. DZ06 TaxID=3425126 RepID=UPI003D3249AC
MSHTPHALADQLPDQAEAISARKQSDPHFARLADEYHELNREIHRGETNVEPMDDMHLEELKKKRLALLDQIKGMLEAA